jgi:hypothetical protein
MELQKSKRMKEQEVGKNTGRSFWGKLAIVGPTGAGKSYLSKTADRDTTGYINMERKPLPYKEGGPFKFMGMPKNWASFKANLEKYGADPEIKQIIIDSQTMAFNTLNKEMAQNFTGFDVYKNYNRQVYEYIEILKNIEKDVIVFSHDEWLKVEGEGKKRMMSVHGKEFEGKIEQHFTIVLYTGTRMKDGKPQYFLKTFEQDTSTKVPEGMFPDKNGNNHLEIPNDGKYIFDCMSEYYSL